MLAEYFRKTEQRGANKGKIITKMKKRGGHVR